MEFTESVLEEAALSWLAELGYAIKSGSLIAPGELFSERTHGYPSCGIEHLSQESRLLPPDGDHGWAVVIIMQRKIRDR